MALRFFFVGKGSTKREKMNEGAVTQERLSEMKRAIHQFLSQGNVYSSIRDIIDSYVAQSQGATANPGDPDELMRVLKEKGVLQTLLSRLRSEAALNPVNRQGRPTIPRMSEGDFFLHMRLSGGRAFVDNLSLSGEAQKSSSMFAAAQFGRQRFRSVGVECSTDPEFSDDFVFHLDATTFGFSPESLIEITTPLHLAVFREETLHHTAVLIGENTLDWRRVLKTGLLGLTVELCGRNPGVPAGILDLQLELFSSRNTRYSEGDILARLDQQREAITAADREFLIYARRWWLEYQGINRKHKERKVKVFAGTTNGRMVPVTHFISPLQTSYGLSSPLDALRFVSLLKATDQKGDSPTFPLEEAGDSQSWLSTFVFISQRQGHSCNHAALLCSLLLGFGLDAYCGIGTTSQNDTGTFVVVRNRTNSGGLDVSIWDPLLGERSSVHGAHSFATIDCLFNHKVFFANSQATNAITTASFELDNDTQWKAINPLKLRLVPKYPGASLVYQPIDCDGVERSLELAIRAQVAGRRDTIGQQTAFDENLSYVLGQALDGYETQRRLGKNSDFSLFEQCVKGLLGPGKTFKALPVNVSNEDDQFIVRILTSNDAGKEIIETVALDDVKFGVRVRVFPFPESVRSVWVMIAVSYRIQA